MADEPEHLLSFSQAEKWHDCQRGWWYRYVGGIKDEGGPDAVRGSLVHAVLEVLGNLPPAERTRPAAFEAARTLAPAGAAWDGITQNGQLQRAAWSHVVTALDMPEVAGAEVVSTELRFETDLDGIPFRGAIDAVVVGHRGLTVRDYKDGSGKWRASSFDRAKKKHQLTAYADAYHRVTGEDRPRDAEAVWTALGVIDHYPVTDNAVAKTVGWLRRAWDGIGVAREATEPEQVEASPGALCAWCPAVGECPVGLGAAASRLRQGKSMGEPGLVALAGLERPAA